MKINTKTLVGVGVLTAIVIVLQSVFGTVTVGGTSINPLLVPVVVGAAIYGWKAGTWLGFVSGAAILISGVASGFMVWSITGTIVTVLLKGAVSGLAAGLVYKLLSKVNTVVAAFAAAITCPVVNTAIFFLGCWVFFLENIAAEAAGGDVFVYIITVYIGVNFLVELGINIILAPAITRLIKIGKKQ